MNLLKKLQLIGLCLCIISSPLVYAATADCHMAVAGLKQEIEQAMKQPKQDDLAHAEDIVLSFKALTSSRSTSSNIESLKQSYYNNLNAIAAGGKAMGYDLSCDLLLHGLEEKPCDLTYGIDSKVSLKLSNSSYYTAMIEHFKMQLAALPSEETAYFEEGTLALSDDADLYLSLNKVSYQIAGEKVGLTWTIYVKISDTYDFNYWEMSPASINASKFATTLNNYGYKAQLAGVISPYHIVIYDEFN